MIFKILKYPDHRLLQESAPIYDIDKIFINNTEVTVDELLDSMIETAKAANGCGLAAPQIGLNVCVCVCLLDDKWIKMINPEVSSNLLTETKVEGCLSLPGKKCSVRRYKDILVKYKETVNGNIITKFFSDQNARTIQHEVDHLKGVLIIKKTNEPTIFS